MLPQNAAHWHLMLNHLVVVGTMAGTILLILSHCWSSEDLKRLSLWWFLVVSLIGIPVYLTGEPAEELVEGIQGVSHDHIEHHETFAMWSFALLILTGLVALVGLGLRYTRRGLHEWFFWVLTGVAVLTAGFMMYTATLGGRIRHPEIHPGFTPVEEHEEKSGAFRNKGLHLAVADLTTMRWRVVYSRRLQKTLCSDRIRIRFQGISEKL